MIYRKQKKIYSEKLGLEVREEGDMGLSLHLAGDTMIFIYPKSNHQPAEFTILNFAVDDIDAAMESLKNKGIQSIQYNDDNLPQDEKGVLRGIERTEVPILPGSKIRQGMYYPYCRSHKNPQIKKHSKNNCAQLDE
ncbi:MAG: VOC family protein [Balneolaceae bacterium]